MLSLLQMVWSKLALLFGWFYELHSKRLPTVMAFYELNMNAY
jgi:hypothetical protein